MKTLLQAFRHVTIKRKEESRGAYRVLIGKPERMRPLGRPKYMWEDGIKTDIREIQLVGMDLIPGKFQVQIWTTSLNIRTEDCYTFLILP